MIDLDLGRGFDGIGGIDALEAYDAMERAEGWREQVADLPPRSKIRKTVEEIAGQVEEQARPYLDDEEE